MSWRIEKEMLVSAEEDGIEPPPIIVSGSDISEHVTLQQGADHITLDRQQIELLVGLFESCELV